MPLVIAQQGREPVHDFEALREIFFRKMPPDHLPFIDLLEGRYPDFARVGREVFHSEEAEKCPAGNNALPIDREQGATHYPAPDIRIDDPVNGTTAPFRKSYRPRTVKSRLCRPRLL